MDTLTTQLATNFDTRPEKPPLSAGAIFEVFHTRTKKPPLSAVAIADAVLKCFILAQRSLPYRGKFGGG